ncbi:hypothetical protein GCM10009716_43080 [Streptomyces sodiiphilus]|uniref:non-specific serine/threonine protein kinase n=1 Tax=Streptomyces sodiiphilus TaxID=226217 RepID=A0ABP5B7S9_9ACTN
MEEQVLDGRYRIGQLLGEGGMGTVWEAEDLRLERLVAVKILGGAMVTRDPRAQERFEREAKLLAGLSSPFIVTVHDVGEAVIDGHKVLYLVMERLQGRSLEQILADELPPLAEVARWGEQICRALLVAHEAGVIHRDLKPANVMVEPDGLARVLDFGIAAVLAESADHMRLTSTGVVVGTPAYMSPEQIEAGSYGPGSDLYALGCMLYALATGRPPFHSGSLYSLMRQQMERDADPPSSLRGELPEEWDELILALLRKDPEDRPGSAAEVAEVLRDLSTRAPQIPAAEVAGAEEYQPTRVDPRAVHFASCSLCSGGGMPMASGQRMRLADLSPDAGAEGLKVVLDWEVPQDADEEERPDVDASALLVDAGGAVLSDRHFVFYNNLDPGDRSVWLEEPDGDDGRFGITPELLEEEVDRIVFALSIHDAEARGHDLSMVEGLHIRLNDTAGGSELLCFGFPRGPQHSTGLTMGELYRDGQGGWGFHAISRGFAGGLAQIAEEHGVNVRGDAEAEAEDVEAGA